MTARQMVIIASRMVCLWFLYQAAMSLIGFVLYAETAAALTSLRSTHFHDTIQNLNLYIRSGVSAVTLLMECLLAVVFYRCGPMVSRFLSGSAVDEVPGNYEPGV